MGEPMTERKIRAPSTRRPRAQGDEPQRQGRARAVGDMVSDVGRASFRRFGFVQSSVVSRWGEIVGPRYAGVSAPESIRFPKGQRADGVLTLTVEGAHAPMLQHVAPEIVDRVNRFFGYPAVARIVIKQATAAKPVVRRAPPSLKPVPVELGESLRTIADPELRACLESLAGALVATKGPPVLDDGKP
nr:DciA family protein [Sphingomonas sp. KC8]